MDKGKLKNFACEARKRLIDHTGARIRYILTHDTPELAAKAELKEKLRASWENTSDREEFIERHAYTLFNRLIALRYMDVKGYNFVPVVSPRVAGGDPAILADARKGLLPAGLPVDTARVRSLLSGEVPAVNPFNEAYKLLFIAACAGFNKTMPFMFEPLNSYTEILLPDDLLSANSILAFVNENLGEEECENVEVIGWLYQYYVSERKDKASEKIKKNQQLTKGEITAYTQIFTRKWIVKYLVENSVGRIWLKNNKNSALRDKLEFFLNDDELKTEAYPRLKSPEDFRLLDPSCGSGHMLVYMFELLVNIYTEAGYYIKDIPELILKNNLFGMDIDPRAVSLSSFALVMKAMEYDRRFVEKGINPHVFVLNSSIDPLTEDNYTEPVLKDIEILGSLIKAESNLFTDVINNEEKQRPLSVESFVELGRREKLIAIFCSKFHAVITNPPYLNPSTNPILKDYVVKRYPIVKGDLFACFIERSLDWIVPNGYAALVTMQSWMFLSSFEKFRDWLLKNRHIVTLGHYDNMVMGIAFGTSGFVLQNGKGNLEHAVYYKVSLSDLDEKDQVRDFTKLVKYIYDQSNFAKIPGAPIAYWVSEKVISAYNFGKLGDSYKCRKGMDTGENERFLRLWFEVSIGVSSVINHGENIKWFPYNKGGDFRKWYGNRDYFLNWASDGAEIKSCNKNLVNKPTFRNMDLQRKESLTWTSVSSGDLSLRFSPAGAFFDNGGSSLFGDQLLGVLGFLNSVVSRNFLKFIAPTINYQPGDLEAIAYHHEIDSHSTIIRYVTSSISISREDWDARETSWDFQGAPLLAVGDSPLLEERYAAYKAYWSDKFFQLHRNEEELNRIFIDIYGLQDELTPDVALEDVTILQPEKVITADGGLDFKTDEVVRQFISYAVGCMFGRYSLDKPGLILANQGETLHDYLAQVPEPRFLPDEDNIIPVLDDEYFEDDIVSRFHRFLEAALGKESFSKNLSFIEGALGMELRRYFNTKFYDDHLRRYKKRPIYWMVSSPGGSFKALIYMHRYNSQTMSKLFNDYLKEYRSKLAARLNDLRDGITLGANPVREEDRLNRAIKDTDDLILTITPLAMSPVAIDLDDGVKVNISKFRGVVREV